MAKICPNLHKDTLSNRMWCILKLKSQKLKFIIGNIIKKNTVKEVAQIYEKSFKNLLLTQNFYVEIIKGVVESKVLILGQTEFPNFEQDFYGFSSNLTFTI